MTNSLATTLLLLIVCASGWPLLETLWWWRLWRRHAQRPVPVATPDWQSAVVFLTGINDFAAGTLEPEQAHFLAAIRECCQADLFITAAFPYEKQTAAAFRPFDLARRVGLREPPLWLFSLRNFWQTMLATWGDRAYGRSVAACIMQRLGSVPPGPNRSLLLLCGSTGAAMAIAASPYLKQQTGARIRIIALGGVWGGVRGWAAVDEFHQLLGTRDLWARLAGCWPGCWLPFRHCQRAAHKFQRHTSGPHKHYGPHGYLSLNAPPEHPAYYEQTLHIVQNLL